MDVTGDDAFSTEITFNSRILQDYSESVGNRVIKIKNISLDFQDQPRNTPFSEIGRYDISGNKENRFIVYVKDRLFEGLQPMFKAGAVHLK